MVYPLKLIEKVKKIKDVETVWAFLAFWTVSDVFDYQ